MKNTKLTLYIAGSSSRSIQAIENLRALCAGADGADSIEYEVVDILEHPELAEQEKVFATPMLVKTSPPPRRRLVGDLNDRTAVKQRLNLG